MHKKEQEKNSNEFFQAITPGDIIGVLGANGSGKTRFLHALLEALGLSKIINDTPYFSILNNHSFVFVPTNISVKKEESVYKWCRRVYPKQQKKDLVTIYSLIEQKHISLEQSIQTICITKKYQILYQMISVFKPNYLILDQPFPLLDSKQKSELLELIQQLRQTDKTIIFTASFQERISYLCTKTGIVKDGTFSFLQEEKMAFYNQYLITLNGSNFKKLNLPMKDIIICTREENEIQFIYQKPINQLFSILATQSFEKLWIEPVPFEIILQYPNKEK